MLLILCPVLAAFRGFLVWLRSWNWRLDMRVNERLQCAVSLFFVETFWPAAFEEVSDTRNLVADWGASVLQLRRELKYEVA